MKILIMTDSMFISTGQGRVGKELALGLGKRGHQVGYIGWFHRPDIIPNAPYNIHFWWTNDNQYGGNILDRVVEQFQPDVLLTIGDFWNLWYISDPGICRTRRRFQWCSYIPVDGEPVGGGLPPSIIKVIEDVDIPIAYTNYALDACLKSIEDQETRNRLKVIYHGVDTNLFKPGDPKQRIMLRERYGINDKFVFLTVSRNQSRKNIPELFNAWKKFSNIPEVKDKVVFWPHMNFKDTMGWNIDEMLDILKMRNHSIMYYDQMAHAPSDTHMIPNEELAILYQIADAFILLSGEGFGLPTFEAMATKLPCILLDHSASAEIGAEGRANLVKVAGSLTWTGRHLTQRPLPDQDDTVNAMMRIFKDKKYRDEIAEKGFEFATKYTWESVSDQWHSLFMSQEVPFIKPLTMEVVV